MRATVKCLVVTLRNKNKQVRIIIFNLSWKISFCYIISAKNIDEVFYFFSCTESLKSSVYLHSEHFSI